MKGFTNWETPQDFFDALYREFRFTLDVAAQKKTAKCKRFFTPKENGLAQYWSKDIVWLNPPYNKTISLWIKKAYETAQQGGLVVCLIQGRSTDTIMWHDYVMKSSELRYVRDRLHFGKNGKHARANISSVLVVFRPYCSGPPTTSSINIHGEKINRQAKQEREKCPVNI